MSIYREGTKVYQSLTDGTDPKIIANFNWDRENKVWCLATIGEHTTEEALKILSCFEEFKNS